LKEDPKGPKTHVKKCVAYGVNKNSVQGSFIIEAYAIKGNSCIFLGAQSFLSRWNRNTCPNCQVHSEAKAYFDLNGENALAEAGDADRTIAYLRQRGKPVIPHGAIMGSEHLAHFVDATTNLGHQTEEVVTSKLIEMGAPLKLTDHTFEVNTRII